MNRNTRTLVVLAVAILMAVLASFGVWLTVRSMPVREVEIARAQAVVAARPLSVGTMVTKDDVKVVPWPAANQVPGSFTAIDKVVNRGVIVATAENEPLTEGEARGRRFRRGSAAHHTGGDARDLRESERDHWRCRFRHPRYACRCDGDGQGARPENADAGGPEQCHRAHRRHALRSGAGHERGQADPDERGDAALDTGRRGNR